MFILPGKDRKEGFMEPKEIVYPSSADGTEQPALFWRTRARKPAPLLVALHTWTNDFDTPGSAEYFERCRERRWNCVYPSFRGPGNRPEAGGSDLVVRDIVSAVDYAKMHANVDPFRIYLAGYSGGGHAGLLMAGRAPSLWAGVSVWVPVSDLAAWYEESLERANGYAEQVAACCGGKPGDGPEVDREYERRSPVTWLENARGLPLDINAGIRDGHDGSVPIDHSLRAFNRVADPEDRVPEADIAQMTAQATVPERIAREVEDAAYGKKKPLFRRVSGASRVTLFDGAHEIVHDAAFAWLGRQVKPA